MKKKKQVVTMQVEEFKKQCAGFERMIDVICPTHLLLKVPEAPLSVSEKNRTHRVSSRCRLPYPLGRGV